jgi:hypothetical protein
MLRSQSPYVHGEEEMPEDQVCYVYDAAEERRKQLAAEEAAELAALAAVTSRRSLDKATSASRQQPEFRLNGEYRIRNCPRIEVEYFGTFRVFSLALLGVPLTLSALSCSLCTCSFVAICGQFPVLFIISLQKPRASWEKLEWQNGPWIPTSRPEFSRRPRYAQSASKR